MQQQSIKCIFEKNWKSYLGLWKGFEPSCNLTMKFFIDLDGCMNKGQKVSTMVVVRYAKASTKLIERMEIP